jgi:hypothetical protein
VWRRLDEMLVGAPAESPAPPGDAETEALELARRASASDVGESTLAQLEQLVDDLASSYATTQPAALLARTRQHLRYVGRLLDGRKTLREAALTAVLSGHVVPSSWWRVREVVRAGEALGAREALPLREAFRDLRATGPSE